MLKNYFKTAWRNLLKNRVLSFINIGGLAIGIASSMLLLNYVSFQFSYDSFHAEKENIFRVDLHLYQNNKLVFQSAENYAALGPALKKDYPEVAGIARLYNMGYKNNCVFTYNNHSFKETQFLYAEASFLTMFSFPFLQGDPRSALSQPNTAVISESASRRIFGNQSPLGQFIKMDDDDRNSAMCEITGVFKDIPQNSHLQFNILISYSTLYLRREGVRLYENNWGRKDFYTYVLLQPDADPALLETKLPSFIKKHIPEEQSNQRESKLVLQPLTKIHLTSNLIDEPRPTGNEKALSFLIIIAFFIITIAWVNYINLTTAGSVNRAKEIGIRKVLGSQRAQLIKQFLIESLTINIISFGIALLIIFSLQPLLSRFFQVEFLLSDLLSGKMGLIFIGFMMLGTFFAGLYPAFVLSSFKPILVLKGVIKTSGSGLTLRKSLVIFQFSLSIFLIIGTAIVYQQVHYMLNQNLGINVSQVIAMDRPGRWDTTRSMHNVYVERFKELLTKNPAIESVGMSDELPGKEIRNPGNYALKNAAATGLIPVNTIGIDNDFLHTLGIHFLAGRNFSTQYKTDQGGLILTESAARLFGFKNLQDAIGKELVSDNTTYSILGVVNDFHQVSLQKKAEPAIFQFNGADARQFEYYLVKVKTMDVNKTVDYIKASWDDAFKGSPFGFSFLDEYFNRQYKNEIQFGMLFGAFSLIAIAIACVGLFALVAFMIEQRIKEIGIRKILGASIEDIIMLLTRDFVKLVLLANLIAWPLGWWLMNNWLKDFAYRISIDTRVFIASGAAALLIALITISFQAIKAAIASPVKHLRAE